MLYRFGVVDCKGGGIAGHSSTCYEKSASAILEAAHKIIELEKMKENDGITCNCGVIHSIEEFAIKRSLANSAKRLALIAENI